MPEHFAARPRSGSARCSSSKPLVAQHSRWPAGSIGLELRQQRAKGVAGHRDQHIVDAVERRLQVGGHLQAVGKRRLGQVALIDALARHRCACAADRGPTAAPACPARAHWIASAVPHEPAPSTAMPAARRLGALTALVLRGAVGLGLRLVANSASKLTGGSSSCGKPPWLTSCETTARAYGNSTPGQITADGAPSSSSDQVLHQECAGLLHLDQKQRSARPAWPRP